MVLEIDYVLRDKDTKELKLLKTLKLTEEDIKEIMQQRFQEDQLPIPIHLNKEKLVADFSIRGGSF